MRRSRKRTEEAITFFVIDPFPPPQAAWCHYPGGFWLIFSATA